jgi:hypothetical protein
MSAMRIRFTTNVPNAPVIIDWYNPEISDPVMDLFYEKLLDSVEKETLFDWYRWEELIPEKGRKVFFELKDEFYKGG